MDELKDFIDSICMVQKIENNDNINKCQYKQNILTITRNDNIICKVEKINENTVRSSYSFFTNEDGNPSYLTFEQNVKEFKDFIANFLLEAGTW